MHVRIERIGALVPALGWHEGTHARVVERAARMALAPGLRSLDLTPLRGREARTRLRGIDILSSQDRLYCRAQVGLRRGGRRRGGRCGGAHEKLAVKGVEGVVDRLAGGDEVLQVRLAGETRRGLVHAPPHLAGAERLPHRMGGSHAVSTLQGPHERVGGVDHERDAAPRHLAVSVGGKGLEEVEDVLLGTVEGAVELDAGIAVVGVEPGKKVEVVGMDGLRGLGQAGVSRRIVVHCRILGACRSVAAVRGLLLPRPRGLISGHAWWRWNFTAVSLTRAPFAGSVNRIPNHALPRKPEMARRQRPPSRDILFVTFLAKLHNENAPSSTMLLTGWQHFPLLPTAGILAYFKPLRGGIPPPIGCKLAQLHNPNS